MSKSKYDTFPTVFKSVPVQYGKVSKRMRKCKHLGSMGNIDVPPYEQANYYRICTGEIGAGRFFYEHIKKNGKQRILTIQYLRQSELPNEIKNGII